MSKCPGPLMFCLLWIFQLFQLLCATFYALALSISCTKREFAEYFEVFYKNIVYMFSSGIQFYWWYWWYRSLRSQVCGKTWGKFLREKANASQSPPYTISGLTATEELYWMQMQCCCWSATTLLLRGKNSHKHFTIESRGGKYISCHVVYSSLLFLIFTIVHINVST